MIGGEELLDQQARDFAEDALYASVEMVKGESPIERLLYRALYLHVALGGWGFAVLAPAPRHIPIEGLSEPLRSKALFVFPQAEVAGWRVDFLLQAWAPSDGGAPGKVRSVIVECDGHDFHERTKEQAARDRARDRQAQVLGFTVLRFTGAEIHRDPMGCAYEIAHLCSGLPAETRGA